MKPVFSSEQRFRPGMHVFVNRAYEAFSIPLHSHDAIEISFVVEGSGYQYINGDTVVRVKRGDIYLLPIGTSHVYRPPSPEKSRTLGIINCVFRPQALEAAGSFPPPDSLLHRALFTPEQMPQPWFHHYDTDSAFTELFQTMLAEYRQRQPGYEPVVHALFIQLIAKLHRSTLITEPSGTKGSGKIEEAIRFITRHCHEPITLKQVAEYSFLSESHLQRLFRQATGTTFISYLQNLRIHKSCELLKATGMTVQQIAGAVGYQDMKHFHALFRQRTGTTPQEYRKNGDPVTAVSDFISQLP
ncbi:helix-turn-helix domain-containing protein [Paenibacillus allorhizosphaerae]|uniref:Arabinose operon regulatory protein n=1 Tax=Paenibacillus allorhizosphaerae TaxID=2849866 RepID=A0ABN7TU13_9BACL|nr:helix-turn-helix domain-containing protein [Paenibacillus allorhizosphaerae]CAG7655849.1 Arabinose operon regulatory protein [Paenibacillus allorhizosphaerae]